MAVNHVIFGAQTLIDLRNDTVEADKLRSGYTAHDAGGNLITGALVSAALEPYVYEHNCGYIASGRWVYENPTQTYIDIYVVEANHRYFITLGAEVGTRFRAMFTTTDISKKTSGSVTGSTVVNVDNPEEFRNVIYTPSSNGYIAIGKDNVGKSGLKTYVYDTTLAWL